MTDRRAVSNGKTARRPEEVPTPPKPMTYGEYWGGDNARLYVRREEMRSFGEDLAQSVQERIERRAALREADRRRNRIDRRIWRHLVAWWAYLLTPQPKGQSNPEAL